ncbi:MAG: AAA family ATPase [Acidobacteriota bacterium]
MARKIVVANQKGGVGKTTTAINLSASLASAEARTLLVDFDPQGNATAGLGFDRNCLQYTVYDVLCGDAPVKKAIHPTETENLFLLPARSDLTGATVELLSLENSQNCLREILQEIESDFEYILIDCPPSLGILTINALVAADSLLVPIQCEYFALEGLSDLLNTLERIRQGFNPGLQIEGVLLTMFDERLNLSSQIAENVKEFLGEHMFETIIPRNVRLAEAPSFGKPIIMYDPRSKGADSYMRLARELLTNGIAAASESLV